ncbi:MAG TPA: oligosaccharide flippase family protein, partial [Fimbriimonadaceae bacterium]|nr:oligosaccharide flippase family protein [Fimbriimonadaceae bacterium]
MIRLSSIGDALARKGGFGRSVAILATGTAISQLIAVAVAPILTRIYTPEHFGVLAVFSGLLAYVTSVSALCYEKAILVEREDSDAFQVLGLSLMSVILVTVTVTVIVGFGGASLLRLLDSTELLPYLWTLPVCVLLAGANLVLSVWATRKHAFSALSASRVSQGVIRAGLQLGLGFAGFGAAGLVLGDAAGRAGGSTTLIKATLADRSTAWSKEAVVAKAKRFRNFPLISTWSTLLH